MQVMIEVTNPFAREQTMTKVQDRSKTFALKELLERDEDFVRSAVQSFVQAALEAEMTEALAAEKGERTEGRLGYRSGYYSRALITRVGTLELRVRRTGRGGFRRTCSSVISARKRRWLGRWRRCMCKAFRQGK